MEPYLSEIRLFSFGFAPRGWLFCNGALLAINQYQALFALIGTTYGGNGTTNFQLPNLMSRTPISYGTDPTGTTYVVGENGGLETVTLTTSTMPQHNHAFMVKNANGTGAEPGDILAIPPPPTTTPATTVNVYNTAQGGSGIILNPATLSNTGGSTPHENMQPFLTLNFCICISGIFPSRN